MAAQTIKFYTIRIYFSGRSDDFVDYTTYAQDENEARKHLKTFFSPQDEHRSVFIKNEYGEIVTYKNVFEAIQQSSLYIK